MKRSEDSLDGVPRLHENKDLPENVQERAELCIVKLKYLLKQCTTMLEVELQPALEASETLLFEPNVDAMHLDGLEVADGLLTPKKNSHVVVPVENRGSLGA